MSIAKINTVRLQNLSWAFTQSAVLFAAIEADFFSKISEGLDTEQKLEAALGSGAPWGKPCFGRSPSPDSATTASSRSRPRAYHEATYSVGMGAARKFMREVDLSGVKKIIDLGGGSGAYSIVAAKTQPNLEAIVLTRRSSAG